MLFSQETRSLEVFTPLGKDVLLLRSMSGSERLSTLFEYELELISKNISIKPEDLLGQPVTVRLDLPDYQKRYFNGLVSRFSHTGFDGDLARYQATVVPWLWFLSRTSDCRIFQDRTVPDIVKEIFRESGYSDFEEILRHDLYLPRNYCVQYRESDFAFISRLLEQEGIYYYFKHEADKHTLILADNYGAHDPIPGYEEIPYYPPDETALRERDHISSWSLDGAVQPGVFVHTDFDFKVPRRNLLTERLHPHEHAREDLEVYEYPGGYTDFDQGDQWARARMEEQYVGYETAQGAGNARGLTTGSLFTLTRYPRRDQNREYLILAAKYELQSDAFGSAGQPSAGPVFQCWFIALDARTPFRPPRTTLPALVRGPQTAIVVGKEGEEIWTDKYGRVKVQFHWDRYGKSDEHSSCWVRVSHPWAGKNWGAVAIPRIGQEVIVEFLEGNPDRPIITGRVYNDVNKPPYGLPGSAAISGLMSNSTKGGSGYNEYILDDTKGNDLIREHGQFDKDSTIEHDLREHVLNDRSRDVTNNETIQVGNDRSKTIGNNETTTIGTDRTEKVGNNETIGIGNDRTETVGANEVINVVKARTRSVGTNETVKVGGQQALTVGRNQSVDIGADLSEKIGESREVTIGTSLSEKVGTDWSETVGKNHSLNVGENRSGSIGKDDSLKVGKNLVIDAGDSVTIKTGKASISMKKDGTITIQGKDITVKGSGGITAKASKNVVIKGKKVLEN